MKQKGQWEGETKSNFRLLFVDTQIGQWLSRKESTGMSCGLWMWFGAKGLRSQKLEDGGRETSSNVS